MSNIFADKNLFFVYKTSFSFRIIGTFDCSLENNYCLDFDLTAFFMVIDIVKWYREYKYLKK